MEKSLIRECLRCNEEMREVWLNQTLSIEEKTKNIMGLFKRKASEMIVFVCSDCGQIEFVNEHPDVFKTRS